MKIVYVGLLQSLLRVSKVYINDRDIDQINGLNTKLEDKFEVCMLIASNDPSGG